MYSANPVGDISERMKGFNEMNFYDGTLNYNMTLEQAYTNMAKMFKDLGKEADKSRNLPSAQNPTGKGPQMVKGGGRASKRAAARRARGRRGGGGGGSDLFMGMISEEGGTDFAKLASLEVDNMASSGEVVNELLDGEEAMDLFMDQSNPYQKTIHSALPTAVKEMEKRLSNKGDLHTVFPDLSSQSFYYFPMNVLQWINRDRKVKARKLFGFYIVDFLFFSQTVTTVAYRH